MIRIQLKMNFLSLNQKNKLAKITPLRTCTQTFVELFKMRASLYSIFTAKAGQTTHSESKIVQNQQEWRRLYTLHSTEA